MKMSKLEQMHAQMMARKLEKQKGATLIEYALVAAGVAGLAALFFTGNTTSGFGAVIQGLLDDVSDAIGGDTTGGTTGG